MQCPRCMKNNTTIISNTHYVCNEPTCTDDNGNRTQFRFVPDSEVRFPYNQIFVDKQPHEFFRKPYLDIELPVTKSLIR